MCILVNKTIIISFTTPHCMHSVKKCKADEVECHLTSTFAKLNVSISKYYALS